MPREKARCECLRRRGCHAPPSGPAPAGEKTVALHRRKCSIVADDLGDRITRPHATSSPAIVKRCERRSTSAERAAPASRDIPARCGTPPFRPSWLVTAARRWFRRLTASPTTDRVLPVTATVDSFLDEYVRRYGERDMEGVTDLCVWPFVAIRKGEAIHLPDCDAVRDHFASAIEAYRLAGRREVDAGRDRRPPTWRALRLRDRALECARRRRECGPRNLDELPAARDSGRVAARLVHESLLSLGG
jgi:hypothetical protein